MVFDQFKLDHNFDLRRDKPTKTRVVNNTYNTVPDWSARGRQPIRMLGVCNQETMFDK